MKTATIFCSTILIIICFGTTLPGQEPKLSEKGPFLQFRQNPSQGEIVVVWETKHKSEGWVEYRANGAAVKKVRSPSKTKRHEVALSGLQPGTTYTYQIGGGASDSGIFTLPKRDAEKFRFVVFGAPRACDQTTWELIDRISG